MATLNTTVKVTEGNFTRFNNILSTLTTGDNLDFRQITADALLTNSAGDSNHAQHRHWRRRACAWWKTKVRRKKRTCNPGHASRRLGAETDYIVVPPSSAILLICLQATTAA